MTSEVVRRACCRLPLASVLVCFFTLTVCAAEGDLAAAARGTVDANRLNVRARPGLKYEVVAQLERGAGVVIIAKQGEWLGIPPPADAAAWVPTNQVRDGVVSAGETLVYSGPSNLFNTYASLKKGSPVRILDLPEGTSKDVRTHWLRIQPPESAVVWVHRNFIIIAGAEVDKTGEIGNSGADGSGASMSAALIPKPPKPIQHLRVHPIRAYPPDFDLDDPGFIGRPVKISKTGRVIPIGSADKPSHYLLAVEVDHVLYPTAYLRSKSLNLYPVRWQTVSVTGIQRWVIGWTRPMIIVTELKVEGK